MLRKFIEIRHKMRYTFFRCDLAMIAKLAKSTAHFFYEKNIVSGEDEEIYAYGMELFIHLSLIFYWRL